MKAIHALVLFSLLGSFNAAVAKEAAVPCPAKLRELRLAEARRHLAQRRVAGLLPTNSAGELTTDSAAARK